MRYNHFDMLPEKAFQPIGKKMTLEGGGGGGGQQQTSSTTIDPTLKPFVQYGLEQAKGLYQAKGPGYYPGQTYISPSQATQQALQATQQRALQGNPLLPAAQQQQQDVIQGAYLQNNPYFNQAMAGAAQGAQQNYYDAVKQAQSGASQAGRYGSGVSADLQNRAAQTMANTLANKYGEFAYQNYANERAAQNAAALAAPQLAQADYQDIAQLANVGQSQEAYQQKALQDSIDRYNYEANLPYQKLSQYASLVSGTPQGSTTTSTSSGGGKIVCTMMNESYGTSPFRNRVWLAHSASMPNAKTYEKGYHTLFLPLVSFAKGKGIFNRIVKCTLEHIAKHRTADIYKEMRNGKRDTLGRIYRAFLEPLCYVVGKLKGY